MPYACAVRHTTDVFDLATLLHARARVCARLVLIVWPSV